MGAKQQGRLDGFFTVQPKSSDSLKRKARTVHACQPRLLNARQAEDDKKGNAKKSKTMKEVVRVPRAEDVRDRQEGLQKGKKAPSKK
jgi:hypothetical protein